MTLPDSGLPDSGPRDSGLPSSGRPDATRPRSALPRFYPVLDSADWIARALDQGVRMVQLRIKDADDARLRAEIVRARDLAQRAGAILVVNDHWQLAIELDCAWLHLGQEDLDGADLPAIRRAGLRLGVSTHDDAELDRALSVGPDYVALGPVWPTILKKMPWAPQGLDRVREWKRRLGDVPLCAIGGLTPERGAAALAAGADVVSAVTDITLNPDPDARLRAWLAAVAGGMAGEASPDAARDSSPDAPQAAGTEAAPGASRPRTPAGYFHAEDRGP